MTITAKAISPEPRQPSSEPLPADASEQLAYLGVDDSRVAHGGRPRRSLRPPGPAGIVRRAPSPVLLKTKVRNVRLGPG